MRGINDGLPTAVIPPQDDAREACMTSVKMRHVVTPAAPEGVNGLVRITNDGHVGTLPGQRVKQGELCGVEVLELVHEDVTVAAMQFVADPRALPDQPERQADLIAVVDQAASREQLLITLESPGQLQPPIQGVVIWSRGSSRPSRPLAERLSGYVLVLGSLKKVNEGAQESRGVA
jgi:hypothetical protein